MCQDFLLRDGKSSAVKLMFRVQNSALPIIAASVLTKGENVLFNCPALSDIEASSQILRYLGCNVKRFHTTMLITADGLCRNDIPDVLMRKTRSSIIF